MSKTTEKAVKVKKNKSDKKKSSTTSEDSETVGLELQNTTKEDDPASAPVKKEKSSKRKKLEVASATADDVDLEDDKAISARPKKDKSSKKRKAEAVPEAEVAEGSDTSIGSTSDKQDVEPASSERPSKKRKAVLPETEIEVDVTAPEPPSKKALRALKKGKPLPPSKSGADKLGAESEAEDGKAKEPKKEVEKRSEHGIWIGNLPWSVTKEMLQNFFIENSNIELALITRVHMPSPDDSTPANKVSTAPSWKKQHNKGFAYVDFSTAEAAEEAVTLSEELLHGRRVLIKNNKSFEGRPMKVPEEAKSDGKEPSKRVFIGNLRFDATNESIKGHFEQCGPVADIMIATFEDSGKCKGYGWITFETLEAADQAVKGWVPYAEEQDSDSSDSDSDSDSDDEEKEAKAVKAPRKPTTRRRYIDKIDGRPTRREFAEPPQVRYKKRYGKDGTKAKALAAGAEGTEAVVERVRKPKPEKEYESLGKSYAPRLTGAIRKAEGKKVTF